MRLRLTCQETTRLVLEGEDRALPRWTRLLVRVHQGYCRGCTRFSGQVRLMRGALDGWRAYAGGEGEEGGDEGGKTADGAGPPGRPRG
jgi:hypothetical protein